MYQIGHFMSKCDHYNNTKIMFNAAIILPSLLLLLLLPTNIREKVTIWNPIVNGTLIEREKLRGSCVLPVLSLSCCREWFGSMNRSRPEPRDPSVIPTSAVRVPLNSHLPKLHPSRNAWGRTPVFLTDWGKRVYQFETYVCNNIVGITRYYVSVMVTLIYKNHECMLCRYIKAFLRDYWPDFDRSSLFFWLLCWLRYLFFNIGNS